MNESGSNYAAEDRPPLQLRSLDSIALVTALKQVRERSEKFASKAPATPGDTGFASSVKFRLTSRWPSVFFVQIAEDQLQFTPDMKRLFTLSMLISFAMICSCQKQDSAAEQQLAQRKAELDAHEKALDEKEKALADREKATANIRRVPDIYHRIPAGVQRPTPDAAQLKAERDKRMQMLPPDGQRMIPDPAQVQSLREKRRQQMLEQLQRMNAGSAASPGADATSATSPNPSAASPAVKATSPSPSSTPQ